jgi:NTP pyrophosphatase (non-canonical NTP hydrolase)
MNTTALQVANEIASRVPALTRPDYIQMAIDQIDKEALDARDFYESNLGQMLDNFKMENALGMAAAIRALSAQKVTLQHHAADMAQALADEQQAHSITREANDNLARRLRQDRDELREAAANGFAIKVYAPDNSGSFGLRYDGTAEFTGSATPNAAAKEFLSELSVGLRDAFFGRGVRLAGDILRDRCHSAASAAGWWTDLKTGEPVIDRPHVVGEKLMLIVSEIAEAMEGHRKGLMDDKLPHRKMIEVELADAVIRIGDLAGALGLDLGGAIEEKMAFNAQRPDHKPEARMAAGGKEY